MPSSVIEVVNNAVCEIFINGTIDENSPTSCDKVTLKTVCGTYQMFTGKEKFHNLQKE